MTLSETWHEENNGRVISRSTVIDNVDNLGKEFNIYFEGSIKSKGNFRYVKSLQHSITL